jgi:upstream-binding transcription factor
MAAEQPKKPMTAFFLYTNEQRPIIVKQLGEEAKVKGMVVKTAAAQWKNLPDEKKAPYEKKAAAAKAEYDAALESFKKMGGEVVRKRKADKGAKPKKDKDAPKKPAGGGYGQFLAENRERIVKSLPSGSNVITDTAKAAGAQYKALSEDEKKPYEDKFKEKMKEYQAAMEEYKANQPAEKEEEEDEADEPSPPPKKAKKTEKTEKTPTPPKPVKSGKGKGKGRSAAKAATAEVEVDTKVLAEATELGYEGALRNLAGRADVKDLKKSDNDLLGALKTSGGLVNPARRALLGA